MPDQPYRPDSRAGQVSPELARLAAEGRRRIADASSASAAATAGVADRAHERNLRVALGGHYGTPLRTAAGIVVVGLAALLVVTALWSEAWAALLAPALVAAAMWRIFLTPTASAARVAAEEVWVRGLPFVLEGYFETLGEEPKLGMHLSIALAWSAQPGPRDEELVRSIVGLVDTGAQVQAGEGIVRVQTGRISGYTWLRSNGGPVRRNTRIVTYVHALVDRVLLPLHRSAPLTRVSIARR